MKRTLLLIAILLLASPAFAQHHERQPRVEDLVTNLTAKQKRQLEAIDNETRPQIGVVKKELKQVRDSLHTYLALYGDHSRTMYRLMEREAALQLKMNKMLYDVKVRIDKVLTAEQHREMQSKMAKHKEQCKTPSRPKPTKGQAPAKARQQ